MLIKLLDRMSVMAVVLVALLTLVAAGTTFLIIGFVDETAGVGTRAGVALVAGILVLPICLSVWTIVQEHRKARISRARTRNIHV